MSAELAAFAQQYKRKAQRGTEPNDRGYSREVEALMKRLPAAELSAALNSESDEQLPSPKPKQRPPDDGLPRKSGRGLEVFIRPTGDLRHRHSGSIDPITENPMLIVLGGLPGTGKTAIARELVVRSPSAYLRIDTIEQALMKLSVLEEIGSAGYIVAYELARSNLALGMTVVADCVNPLSITREAWRAVATSTSSDLLEVEIVCSDPAEHRRRVESRKADIPEHTLPTWEAVLRHEYEVWTTNRLVIGSALVSASEAADLILERLRSLAAGE
ncbi:putative kinase [Variovorax paradoxus]|uniref:AAA family ATPase n=1 Tax=Variovorax paradoxus TaxID=34073 RepID=UPI002794B932|nr:AAA family ATPase [Variovorax paradoxus]MDQ0572183.1 putative kinase [Variovorax paradoxus]